MTERIKGFVVTLEEDFKDEDAERISHAIELIKGVVSVVPSISNQEDMMNRERVKHEFRKKIWGLLD